MGDSVIQEIVCCMGQPVSGNPTQFMMEAAFTEANLDWRYLTLEVGPDQLPAAIAGLRAMGFRGATFARPHKKAAANHLDELSKAARMSGIVNCLYRDQDRLIGENTDGKGFMQALGELTEAAGKRIVILGAGSMARAVSVELALAGVAEITVVNRTAEHGENLVQMLTQELDVGARFVHLSGQYQVPAETDVVINATTIGYGDSDQQVPLDVQSLRSEMVVADVIFNPPETWLIREAAYRDCRTIDGLTVLVNQATASFRIWTGVTPDATVMREALEEFLEI